MSAFNPNQLEQTLEYKFKDREILISALTHASSQKNTRPEKKSVRKAIEKVGTKTPQRKTTHDSANAPALEKHEADNERLEFLGDRVLGLVISAALMKLYPASPEGELARRYNSLVRRKTCAEIATEIELGKFLILSAGEERSGGRKKSTILANGMEALLGAIFIDAGYDMVDKIICRLWHNKMNLSKKVQLDAKTALQEWAQGQGFNLPAYKNISRTGPDHNPIFIVEASVGEVGAAEGQGSSKRIAEQNAAKALLEERNVWQNTGEEE